MAKIFSIAHAQQVPQAGEPTTFRVVAGHASEPADELAGYEIEGIGPASGVSLGNAAQTRQFLGALRTNTLQNFFDGLADAAQAAGADLLEMNAIHDDAARVKAMLQESQVLVFNGETRFVVPPGSSLADALENGAIRDVSRVSSEGEGATLDDTLAIIEALL